MWVTSNFQSKLTIFCHNKSLPANQLQTVVNSVVFLTSSNSQKRTFQKNSSHLFESKCSTFSHNNPTIVSEWIKELITYTYLLSTMKWMRGSRQFSILLIKVKWTRPNNRKGHKRNWTMSERDTEKRHAEQNKKLVGFERSMQKNEIRQPQ